MGGEARELGAREMANSKIKGGGVLGHCGDLGEETTEGSEQDETGSDLSFERPLLWKESEAQREIHCSSDVRSKHLLTALLRYN